MLRCGRLCLQQRVAVPRFGNWDKGDNIGYTVYFDNVRKGRVGAKLYNPNDPEENPDLISEESKAPPPAQASYPRSTRTPPNELQGPGLANRVGAPPHEPIRQEMGNRVAQERKTQAQADHGDIRWSLNSSARNDNNIRGKPSHPSTKPQNLGNSGGYGYGELHRRAGMGDGRPENSLERSPLHHHGKASGRGPVGSPARENFSNQSSHGTPGRSRMRPISQGDGNVNSSASFSMCQHLPR